MQPADFERFRNVMTGMAEIYQRELSPVLLDAYWLALRAWTLSEFEQAAAHLLRTATFMPRPSEFEALRKAERMTPMEAWEYALGNCSRWRQGIQGDPDNPLLDRAIRSAGGNERIAMTPTDELHWAQQRFIRAYEEMSEVSEVRQALPALAGPRQAAQLGYWTNALGGPVEGRIEQ